MGGGGEGHTSLMGNRRVPQDGSRGWTLEELHAELGVFEAELVAAGLMPNSVKTYVERSERFLRWLAGDYRPGERR